MVRRGAPTALRLRTDGDRRDPVGLRGRRDERTDLFEMRPLLRGERGAAGQEAHAEEDQPQRARAAVTAMSARAGYGTLRSRSPTCFMTSPPSSGVFAHLALEAAHPVPTRKGSREAYLLRSTITSRTHFGEKIAYSR